MSAAAVNLSESRPSRHAWLGSISASGLPSELAVFVATVCRRARLWPSERDEVARELCSHFKEGLARGACAADLLMAFGDPRLAAKLIGRAQRRRRSWAQRWMPRLAAAVCVSTAFVLLGATATYWHLATRRPNVMPSAGWLLNSKIESLPLRERAWPAYLNALVALSGEIRPDHPGLAMSGYQLAFANEHEDELRSAVPGSAAWESVRRRVASASPQLAELRTAAQFSRLGVTYTMQADDGSSQWLGWLGYTPLYHVAGLRSVSAWLIADVRVAAFEKDAGRALASLEALVNVGSQLSREPFIASHGLGYVTWLDATRVGRELLELGGSEWTDSELGHMQKIFDSIGDGERLMPDLNGARLLLRDALDRTFTDNGYGEGLATDCIWTFLQSEVPPQHPTRRVLATLWLKRSTIEALAASRFEQVDSWASKWPSDRAGRPEAWTPGTPIRPGNITEAFVEHASGVGMIAARVALADKVVAERDGLIAAVAAQRYLRVHSAWPSALKDIPASILSRSLRDPMSGGAMKYEVRNGEARVWTVVPAASSDVITLEDEVTRDAHGEQIWTLWRAKVPRPKPEGSATSQTQDLAPGASASTLRHERD